MFSNPEKNLKTLGLRESDVVADLGAGTGHYVLACAPLVPQGKVYAIEIERDFLETIKRKAKDVGIKNIDTIWGNVEKLGGTKLADGVVDVAIASNILFQLEDKNKFIDEVKRILKEKGKVLLVDWSETSIMGKQRVVPKDVARKLFENKGFVFDREIDAGDSHYGMIVTKG